MGSRAVDQGGDPNFLAGSGDVLAVEEGAGRVLDRFVVRNLRVPVTLVAIESDTAASRQLAASYGLPAA